MTPNTVIRAVALLAVAGALTAWLRGRLHRRNARRTELAHLTARSRIGIVPPVDYRDMR